jgi:hypothetical protein
MEQQVFLTHVREAMRQVEAPIPNITGEWRPLAELASDRDALWTRFVAELGAVGGSAERVAANALTPRVVEIVRGWNVRRATIAGMIEEGLLEALCGAGIEMVGGAEQADFGLSDAFCAIAETGTLVLVNGAGAPRSATALPARHLAILHADQIVPNLREAIEELQRAYRHGWPSCITLVTGPSRSGDIEQILTIGVHGPGNVTVLIVE